MPQTRQLAAIMFTDIVGYTALMEEDEQKAFEILKQNRNIQRPLIEQYGGKWIKELGDGVLASFSTVTDVVGCACSIIKGCEQVEGLQLRIGIHQGEVVFEDNDVFGDGVNIASRLQSLAPIGGIWVSEAVYKNVANKKEIRIKFVREELLKHMKEPVRIYEVDVNSVLIEPTTLSAAQDKYNKTLPQKSIAVLPFINMSNDPEQEYFSDGMAEEIINSLVHLQDLKVAGRMSAFQFKGAKADLREVGEKLGVSTVLEGSVRKQGNKLRVMAQLVNVADGFHLWSEKYDRNKDDIFAIQDEIALSIAEKLKVTLLEKDREMMTKSYTQSTEAYELYLKGRYHIAKRGAFLITSIKFFQQAIDIDPDFALAHAGYAEANLLIASYGLFPPNLVTAKAKQAAERAVELDPSLAEAYCTLGFYYACFGWNWPEARKNLLKSIELNPGYAEAHFRYGWNYLTWIEGNFDEAEKQGKIGVILEPLSSNSYGMYSLILSAANKLKEALAVCKTSIELDPNSLLCQLNEGSIYMALQNYEEAISSYEAAMKISNRHHFAVCGLIWTYCVSENFDKARILMNELKERSLREYVSNTFMGLSAAYLNDLDEAFDYLEKAYSDRDLILLTLKYENWGPAEFRDDPRFQKILDRIGYPN